LDDKSTDNSVDIINKYKDNPHVSHVVINEENSGSTFKQWHKGFEIAKGDVVWIAESDDSCDKSLLETLVRGYVENNAVLAFCRSCKYDVDGNKCIYNLQNNLPWDIVMQGKTFISKYMIDRNVVANASSAIFSRELAMSIDRQYIKMRGNGDWLFWIELMEHGNVFFSAKELNFFRFHHTNTTKSLGFLGISGVEHKRIFDYLVSHHFIPRSKISIEKLKLLDYHMRADYESRSARRKVMKAWDKWLIGRCHIFLSSIKEDIKLFLRNL
jgi:glycosyltransferase involved in cell wall biosynthesis